MGTKIARMKKGHALRKNVKVEKRQRLSYTYLESLVTLDFNHDWYGIDLWNRCKYKCLSKPMTDIITVNYKSNWSKGSMVTANTAGESLSGWELSHASQLSWAAFAFFQFHVAPQHSRSCGYRKKGCRRDSQKWNKWKGSGYPGKKGCPEVTQCCLSSQQQPLGFWLGVFWSLNE